MVKKLELLSCRAGVDVVCRLSAGDAWAIMIHWFVDTESSLGIGLLITSNSAP